MKDDVVPLFKKEKIEVDYSKRGFYEFDSTPNHPNRFNTIKEALYSQGVFYTIKNLLYVIGDRIRCRFTGNSRKTYEDYLQNKYNKK